MTTTTRLSGTAAIAAALEHGLRLAKHEDPTEGAREGLTVEQAREVAAEDPSLVYVDVPAALAPVHCECGEVYGERCAWTGPRSETVVVEVMPEHLRSSHTAAGARGIATAGRYPANGAERLTVERSCAERLAESEGDWAHVVTE